MTTNQPKVTDKPVGELVRKLLSYCMDWNDEPMADAEEPRVMPYCGELREAASTLTAQAAALVAAETEVATLKARIAELEVRFKSQIDYTLQWLRLTSHTRRRNNG